jgi:predicted glycosyltransferase involved in capsule biosynthesis
MKIALDWDGTYTRNPMFWDTFIQLCLRNMVDVRVVTMRLDRNRIEAPITIPVIYTNMTSKREYCDKIGWFPDIWIDDSPEFIVRRDVLEFLDKFGAFDEKPEGERG